MENLNRGTHAIRTSASDVLVSWRILGTEYAQNATYNLYRDGMLIASDLTVSNYQDNTILNGTYTVSPVIGGTEGSQSDPIGVWADFYKTVPLNIPPGGTTPDNVTYTYEPNDLSIGDLDADGDYEIVIKWQPTNAKDNAHSGYTGNTILEGIEFDGTSLWKIDLGINIRSGAHYTQLIVYDLDGDGDAEVACKTADGTTDGLGNVIGNGSADYRNSSGYILDGPEYLTIFNGNNGAELVTTNYTPPRGNVCDWGDCYGNRVDRFLACVAYLDGVEPSLVMCRGYYTRTALAAYDYRNGSLTQRWVFDTNHDSSNPYEGQGNHNLAVGDVDGDGKDEIMYGACAIDDDGTGLYSTGFGHGDAGHLLDIDPDEPGLEYFMPHETANGSTIPGMSIRNAATGAMQWTVPATGDIGRGISMDIDPNYFGMEVWSSDGSGVFDKDGNLITTTYPASTGGANSYNHGIWWTGDLHREILDRTVINKWDPATYASNRLVTLYNYESATTNNGTKDNPGLSADIMGDWREEVILRSSDNDRLIVFTTTYPTSQRMYTLMHDPVYRLAIAWQNVGYNQPPHLGFYFGGGMSTPPSPNIQLVGSGCSPTAIVPYIRVDSGAWVQTNEVVISQGSTVTFGPQPTTGGSWSWTGCDTSGSSREQTVTPSSSCVANATYTNDEGCVSTMDFIVNVEETILHYAFDETSGTMAADDSGNGNTGTISGGATFSTGQEGNAIVLDGTDDYVTAPAGIFSELNDFTVATWVKLDAASTWSRIFDFGSGTGTYMFLTPNSGSGTFRYAITTSGGGGEQQINGSGPLSTGVWTHVAVTLSGSVGTLYVDGSVVGTNNNMTINPSFLGSTTSNYIGKSQYPDPYLDGMVDEFQVFNYALDASEIAALAAGSGQTATTMHVESIVTGTASAGKGAKFGTATVTILDDQGGLVGSATVTGTFSGSYNETVSGTTATDGTVTLTTSSTAKGNVSVDLCVDDVTHGSLTYDEPSNVITCTGSGARTYNILKTGDPTVNPLRVYPNPAENVITVELNEYKGGETISIVDLSGKNLITTSMTSESIQIDISHLSVGTYLLKVKKANTTDSQLIIIR